VLPPSSAESLNRVAVSLTNVAHCADASETNNATATDADAPANGLVFTLVSGPANMTVSPAGPSRRIY